MTMVRSALVAAMVMASSQVLAAEVLIPVNAIDSGGIGAQIGTIRAKDSSKGMVVTPRLAGLTPGPHGFHIHDNPSCAPKEQDGKPVAGLAAGGHFDPHKSGKHDGPWADGHKGDLPALAVNGDGTAGDSVVAPRLKVADLKGRSVMIHAGADNYSDQPKPLGGGGARVACGVVPTMK
jgi:Cu-Zn family superoxide dismutase